MPEKPRKRHACKVYRSRGSPASRPPPRPNSGPDRDRRGPDRRARYRPFTINLAEIEAVGPFDDMRRYSIVISYVYGNNFIGRPL